jgi:hypothetical protein
MRRALHAVVVVAVISALAVVALRPAASGTTSTTPSWVKHVRNYPGGLSGTVRASLKAGVITATSSSNSVVSRGKASTAVGANIQMNDDTDPPLPQNETQVAYSEDDPLTAVAASNDYVDGGLWIGTTHDGGNTWKSQRLVPRVPQTGDFCSGGDPAVAYSARDHVFYIAQLCFMRAHPESLVQVSESRDGGDHFTGFRYAATPVSNVNADGSVDDSVFYDKEQIAVDNFPSSPHFGRLYVTYIKFHMEPNGFGDYCPVQLAYTDDVDPNNDGDLRDTLFTSQGIQPDMPGDNGISRSANQGAQPAVDDQGGLGISFFQEDCNTSLDRRILYRHISVGGVLGPLVQISRKSEWRDNPNKHDLLPSKFARFPASTSAPLVWNDVTKAFEFITQNNINRNGELTGTPTGADISYTESHNYGATWQHMRFVAVDGSGDPAAKDQMLPWLAVDDTGASHAIWFDNRNDPNNVLIETYHALTSDTDVWGPNDNLSTESWNPNASFFGSGSFVGDYNGIAAGVNDEVLEYPVWTDGRNTLPSPHGQADIYTVPNSLP